MMWGNGGQRQPIFKLTVTTKQNNSEKEITQIISERLISATLDDNRGFEADMLSIQLSDHDGLLALPPCGAVLHFWLGFADSGLVDKGRYYVEEIEFSGAPDTVTLRARAAELSGTLSTRYERSYHQIKIKTLVEQLAAENKLKPLCDAELGEQVIAHLDQQNESTIDLLTRLAAEYDAIATVKNGYLLFFFAGAMQTVSGKPLPLLQLSKRQGDNYRFAQNEGENYKAVRAYYYDPDSGKKGEVVIDENSQIERQHRITKTGKQSKAKHNVLVQTKPVTSDAEQIKTIRFTYKSYARALTGAKSAYDRLKRGVASFSMTLAEGNPEIIPEMPLKLVGFKPMIDSTQWIVTKVTHSLDDNGYTAQIECEVKPSTPQNDEH
ncbi:phage late control D family protein [Gallibacterium anatis]|uniref:phage late control D family protein n=1 Tax=Gallibacterium anatis TaxID=750 RepID=UPI003007183E